VQRTLSISLSLRYVESRYREQAIEKTALERTSPSRSLSSSATSRVHKIPCTLPYASTWTSTLPRSPSPASRPGATSVMSRSSQRWRRAANQSSPRAQGVQEVGVRRSTMRAFGSAPRREEEVVLEEEEEEGEEEEEEGKRRQRKSSHLILRLRVQSSAAGG